MVVEKKFSGKTPSAGAPTNFASGALASSGLVKSGCLRFVTILKIKLEYGLRADSDYQRGLTALLIDNLLRIG